MATPESQITALQEQLAAVEAERDDMTREANMWMAETGAAKKAGEWLEAERDALGDVHTEVHAMLDAAKIPRSYEIEPPPLAPNSIADRVKVALARVAELERERDANRFALDNSNRVGLEMVASIEKMRDQMRDQIDTERTARETAEATCAAMTKALRQIMARHDGGKCTCGGCSIARAALAPRPAISPEEHAGDALCPDCGNPNVDCEEHAGGKERK